MKSMSTKSITLSPAFLAALERVAPKRRRGRIRYVIALAVVVVVAFVAVDPFARDFASRQTRAVVAAVKKQQPPAKVQASAKQPATPVSAPAVITVPTIVIGSDAGGESAAPSPPTSVPAKAKRSPRATKVLSRRAAAIVAAQIPAGL